jgi:hypothetical protein
MVDGRRQMAGRLAPRRVAPAIVAGTSMAVAVTVMLGVPSSASPHAPPDPSTTLPPTTEPPPDTTTEPPTTEAPPPPPPDPAEETPSTTRRTSTTASRDEAALADATEAEAEPAGSGTFTTVANLLEPGDGTAGAQATTTTTAAAPRGGNDADEESRLIWMIIAGLAGVAVLVALLTWRYWLLTRPGLEFDDDTGDPDDYDRYPDGGPYAGTAAVPAFSRTRHGEGGRRLRPGDGGDPFWGEPDGPPGRSARSFPAPGAVGPPGGASGWPPGHEPAAGRPAGPGQGPPGPRRSQPPAAGRSPAAGRRRRGGEPPVEPARAPGPGDRRQQRGRRRNEPAPPPGTRDPRAGATGRSPRPGAPPPEGRRGGGRNAPPPAGRRRGADPRGASPGAGGQRRGPAPGEWTSGNGRRGSDAPPPGGWVPRDGMAQAPGRVRGGRPDDVDMWGNPGGW